MGIHLTVLSESYLMNTNMTEFIWFSKIFAILCFGRNYPEALEGLREGIWVMSVAATQMLED